MGKCNEPGVLLESDRFFNTPSAAASQLFYYITRCGHYFCTTEYNFTDDSEVARLPSHRNCMLFYICSGSLFVENAGMSAIVMPGQVALIDCTLPHHYYAREDTEALWMHLEGCNTKDFFSYIRTMNGERLVLTPPSSHNTKTAMLQLINAFRLPGRMSEGEQSQRIHRLLCELIVVPHSMQQDDDSDAVSQVIDYITQHLFEDLSVSDVAASVNLSPSHLSRLFKVRTGFSPHEFITLRRIDAAKELLLTTKLSVKQIAFRVGYHSEANFITSFSGKTGLTPAVFRKNPI
ncbi:helix-turn-helix domain-containing protein [Butyricicoccus porcorum]|uniref:HTH araC/xylS-type domain-containing protein n=1 Tax=Butyricicoccus porcorum TaxID=1945634 RepID=A0A252F5B3_9FIRM|nr:AraC family transcriptional regulator [Butyricicoccus porcorum]MCI6926040.1 AraC family transcriptional regulator [Butyricicoccus porcorum]MDY4484422.1 AraC family transcriptional regulator [Butyricicoccus porcorum]OUM20959.1 hypothetical protein CBW42_05095 [Butyricicoccus porcorum]